MGGIPAAIGGAVSSIGSGIGNAASVVGGAAKNMMFGGGSKPPLDPGTSADGSTVTLPAKTAENSTGAADPAQGSVQGGQPSAMAKFFGAAKQGLNNEYIQPWKNAVGDFTGNPATPSPAPAPTSGLQNTMNQFFNAPQQETPAMRNRRMAGGQ